MLSFSWIGSGGVKFQQPNMYYFENQGGNLNIMCNKNSGSKAVYNEIKIKIELYYIFLLL